MKSLHETWKQSSDIHRFMANPLVFAMTFVGTTDRTNYALLSQ